MDQALSLVLQHFQPPAKFSSSIKNTPSTITQAQFDLLKHSFNRVVLWSVRPLKAGMNDLKTELYRTTAHSKFHFVKNCTKLMNIALL